ncbi:MAG TPA: GGDEF domain-containing protein [Rhodanobacteraceae bacterium]|nr:GGDEF domain-containing protein [Rhodanobacteraceae bacterium]
MSCWLVLAALPLSAAAAAGSPSELLDRADQQKFSDHDAFLLDLKQLERQRSALSPAQQQRLDYLLAWQAAFAGKYDESSRALRELIGRSKDPELVVRAKSQLIHNLFLGRHYEAAYTLAYELMAEMPQITNPAIRLAVTGQVIQMLSSQGQSDLALNYAHQLQQLFPSGKERCLADALTLKTELQRKTATASLGFQAAIDRCMAAKQAVFANSLRLDWADSLTDVGDPEQAIRMLKRAAPDILKSGYQFHMATLQAALARAYLAKGAITAARSSALRAVSLLGPDDQSQVNYAAEMAYEVLYRVAKKQGDSAAALGYHEHYMTQVQAASQEAKAQALAFQMVRQNVLEKKQKLEQLGRENQILQLRQSLDQKAAENNRLYILLLLVTLGFLALWAFRAKRLQLRFREQARRDSLTDTLVRRHFLELTGRRLAQLERNGDQACLLILDIDHFKAINDVHGHMQGDVVLKQVAKVSAEALRNVDLFGRLGGEEFGILLPGCTLEQGIELGERICRAIAANVVGLESGASIRVTASVGLTTTAQVGWALSALLAQADKALYCAKHDGRNRLRFCA